MRAGDMHIFLTKIGIKQYVHLAGLFHVVCSGLHTFKNKFYACQNSYPVVMIGRIYKDRNFAPNLLFINPIHPLI